MNTLGANLRIGKTRYTVTELHPDPEVADRAFRLTKVGGDHDGYDVRVDRHGAQCECMGFLRWNKPCKHIRALTEAGLLKAPARKNGVPKS
jgi:hypothetical protein